MIRCPVCMAVLYHGPCPHISADEWAKAGGPVARPIPRDQWPAWVNLLARRQQPEDIGVGDSLSRLLNRWGAERLKRWLAWLRIPCGCCERQDALNQLYPYDQPPA